MGNKRIAEIWRDACADGERRPSVTYMLVVDDHAILTRGIVGTHVLLDAPVTAPPAQNTTTATVNRKRSLQPSAGQHDARWTLARPLWRVTHGVRPDSCFTAVQSKKVKSLAVMGTLPKRRDRLTVTESEEDEMDMQ